MTDKEDIFDDEEDDDTDDSQAEDGLDDDQDEEVEKLNEAYDKVSADGAMPNVDDFFSGDDSGDPYGASGDPDGIGREVGDPQISDEAVEEPEPEASDEGNAEPGDLEPDKFNFKQILDGSFFAKETFQRMFPFILFLVGLALLYIGNRNMAESLIKRNLVLSREVRELRAESITIAAQLMGISKETEVANRVEQKKLGIHEQKEPPKIFYIDKFEREDSLKTDEPAQKKRKYTNDFNDFEDDYKKIK